MHPLHLPVHPDAMPTLPLTVLFFYFYSEKYCYFHCYLHMICILFASQPESLSIVHQRPCEVTHRRDSRFNVGDPWFS